jgi:N-hydroxyarylamine O-acetyltransferase
MTALDLQAYLIRIRAADARAPDLATLRRLHLAHTDAIAFENLDIQMGRAVAIDLESVQAKLVRRRRGGYCFEQNTLFLHALRGIGFDVAAREARVRQGVTGVLPRTHMTLLVQLDDTGWLCDVGFGAGGILVPVPMTGQSVDQFGWSFRVTPEGDTQVLQRWRDERWEDLYAIEPGSPFPVDFEVANWFTSTWPRSPFVLTLTAQRATPEVRYLLRNLSYTEERGAATVTREIGRRELIPLLRDTFQLDIPSDARFRALDGAF